eukprot:gene15242-20544_t
MISSHVVASTLCCKSIVPNLLVKYALLGTTREKGMIVTIDSLPSSDLVIKILCKSSSGSFNTSSSIMFYPSNELYFTNRSSKLFTEIAISFTEVGMWYFDLLVIDSVEYVVSKFTNNGNVTLVIDNYKNLPSPVIKQSVFSVDGSFIQVEFDMPTNQGGYSNRFVCSMIGLYFTGITGASCYWTDNQHISIYLSSLIVGSNITVLLNNSITSQCLGTLSDNCSQLSFMDKQTVHVTVPANPRLPVITINGPVSISKCDDILIDLSSSIGSGGRRWQSIIFSVTSSTSSSDLNILSSYLANQTSVSSLYTIPNKLLTPGVSYRFSVTLCNFLYACGVGGYSISVSPLAGVPSVTLSVNLTSTALSPVLTTVNDGSIQSINLVLGGYSLPSQSSLLFTLSCGGSSSSMIVTTNGSPLPGEFNISPSKGTELETIFSYTADFWTDSDLPLSYQFGFYSSNSKSTNVDAIFTKSKSQFSFAYSNLPAGQLLSNNQRTCFVQVFDNLNAVSNKSSVVTVDQADNLLLLMKSEVEKLSSLKASASLQAVSVISSSMNNANCTNFYNCSELYRHECSNTDHICGSCLNGFVGRRGDSNTPCFLRTNQPPKTCKSTSDCKYSQVCENNLCVSPSQRCSPYCSLHGKCRYKSLNTGLYVDKCVETDESCSAVCICSADYTGINCDMTVAESTSKKFIRSILIQNLLNMTLFNDNNEEHLVAWCNLLASVTMSPYELNTNDIFSIMNISTTIVSSSMGLSEFQSNDLFNLLVSIDSIDNMMLDSVFNITGDILSLYLSKRFAFLDTFSRAIVEKMTLNQYSSEIIQDKFRLSQVYQILSSLNSISEAQTEFETVFSDPSNSISFSQLTDSKSSTETPIQLSVMYTAAAMFKNISKSLTANPVQLTINSTSGTPLSGKLILTFQNNYPVNYLTERLNVTTYCNGTDDRLVLYICPISKLEISHNCSKKYGFLTSYCPLYTPSCAILNNQGNVSASRNCSVISFDGNATTCSCELGSSHNN